MWVLDDKMDTSYPENREPPLDDTAVEAIAGRLNRIATLLSQQPQRVRDELLPLLDLEATQSLYLGEPHRRLELVTKTSNGLGLTPEELSILIWAVLRNRESSRR